MSPPTPALHNESGEGKRTNTDGHDTGQQAELPQHAHGQPEGEGQDSSHAQGQGEGQGCDADMWDVD